MLQRLHKHPSLARQRNMFEVVYALLHVAKTTAAITAAATTQKGARQQLQLLLLPPRQLLRDVTQRLCTQE